MSKSKVLTSAKIVCYINGKACGYVTSFGWNSDTPMKNINGIDSLSPYELAPTSTNCTGNIGLVRTVRSGGIEALGMTAHSSVLAQARYVTITLIDRTTDSLLFRADFCAVTNQRWDVPEKGIVRGSVSFTALAWNNECGIS